MPRDSVSPFTAATVGVGLVAISEAVLHWTYALHLQVYAIGIICLAAAVVKAITELAAPVDRRRGSLATAVAALITASALTPVAAARGYALLMNIA